MEQLWTHEILSYNPSSFKSSSTGLNYTPNSWNVLLWLLFPQLLSSLSSSVGWNNPELLNFCPMILLPSITRKFKQFNRVELHQTHEIFFNDPCFVNCSVVQAVWLDELPLTIKILSYDPSSLNYLVFQAVRQDWNTPKLITYSPRILVLSITQ